MTKLELFLKNRSKNWLQNASKSMILSSKNMLFEAFWSQIFERFFAKSSNFVKMALNVKWDYETLVNLPILKMFSLCLMGPRPIFHEITSKPRNFQFPFTRILVWFIREYRQCALNNLVDWQSGWWIGGGVIVGLRVISRLKACIMKTEPFEGRVAPSK